MPKKKIQTHTDFPVVGIGASAGGLDAFKKLLKAIPENSGIAYVLVQHLAPGHESLLPDILQKVTKIPVMQISDDIKAEPNHIYVIPANKILVANDGVLQLSQRESKNKPERNQVIDVFFNSLAEVYQAHAMGVVLSGTASDGTAGLKTIKDYGGITFAQDEASAAYDSMPNSAVQAGVVDFILPPEKIPQKILEITKNMDGNGKEKDLPQKDEEVFRQIISLLRVRKATDFTYYKQTTIQRRILRRMALSKNDHLIAYLKYLRENKNEQDILYQDLLIPVTSFFRDAKNFAYLCETVLPQIIKNKTPAEPIRIWVAGCSTGEEAYSIAICLKEKLDDLTPKIQIFATDVNEPAIAKARTGVYSKRDTETLTPQRLHEFFTKTDGNYQVNKSIRDMCVFALHNFLKDPPFGKIDLISCRNVLIYMEPYLQKKALTTFHYALNTKGVLMLGKSETITSVPELFTVSSNTGKIFIRKDVPGKFIQVASPRSEQNFSLPAANEILRTDFQKMADDIVLNKYTPAGVIINEAMDILHFRGSTGNFLEQMPGKPSHNLLKLAKNGLAFELRNIIHKAKKDKATAVKQNIPLKINGTVHNITIEAIPLSNVVEPHYLILFHDGSGDKADVIIPKEKLSKRKDNPELHIRQLEQELAQAREDMRSITEDQETVNEELQSANEELLSSSEELQSLNEELETGKEELQSTNEELIIVNQELVGLMEQVKHEKEYATSIVETVRDPLIILDKNLRVKSANNSYYKTFRLNEAETEGKLIYELGDKHWNIPELRTLLERILPDKTKFNDFEIRQTFANIGERVMLLNAREIKEGSSEKLILLAIEDITDKERIREHKRQKEELEIAVVERTLKLREANDALEEKNNDLQNLNKELQSFAYVATHDLQEPLRKIQAFTTRLLEKETKHLSDDGIDYFNRMQNAAKRMQALLEDLLVFSRISVTDRKFKDTDLNEILEEVKDDFKEEIKEKNATVQINETCRAKVIPFQFVQLMQNLIGNALKFQKPGNKPRITLGCRIVNSDAVKEKKLLPHKDYCHIMVKDNGIGFESHYSERIFDVFQRLHGNSEYPGTGIGLAIVKKIVENHNGLITATSEVDKGATFDIYIPD